MHFRDVEALLLQQPTACALWNNPNIDFVPPHMGLFLVIFFGFGLTQNEQ
jgi:hypothetical protein